MSKKTVSPLGKYDYKEGAVKEAIDWLFSYGYGSVDTLALDFRFEAMRDLWGVIEPHVSLTFVQFGMFFRFETGSLGAYTYTIRRQDQLVNLYIYRGTK